jgi:hypothetical protein
VSISDHDHFRRKSASARWLEFRTVSGVIAWLFYVDCAIATHRHGVLIWRRPCALWLYFIALLGGALGFVAATVPSISVSRYLVIISTSLTALSSALSTTEAVFLTPPIGCRRLATDHQVGPGAPALQQDDLWIPAVSTIFIVADTITAISPGISKDI